jgi:lipoyl(octanoyl) transferase
MDAKATPSVSTSLEAAGDDVLTVIDAGRLSYADGLALQQDHWEEVLASRDADGSVGRLLLLEHDPPVITVSRRKTSREHLVATPELLEREGVEVHETDRGGDITYHGPGQLVAYPILDLNKLRLNLHAYLRFLEQIVIDTCADFGVAAHRDVCATGVWVGGDPATQTESCPGPAGGAKICAMGVRVRRWVTTHGLALNVTTNLDHFKLIVPCGLVGRPVTSLRDQLGDACPDMSDAKEALARRFRVGIKDALAS